MSVRPATAATQPPSPVMVLGHGAGRGTDTADLLALAAGLPAQGVTVVLVDQPWVLAGRRVASPARHLDDAWTEVLAWLRASGQLPAGAALVVGGRSTGARVACRTAAAVDAQALLLLAFPLRPPSARKDPGKVAAAAEVRLAEWASAAPRPVVLVQGERDPFGSGPDVVAAVSGYGLPAPELVAVPGADHGLSPRAGPAAAEVATLVVAAGLRAAALARAAGARE